MSIDALIFDMDGLMFDSERVYSKAFVLAAADIGMSVTQSDFVELVGKNETQTQRHIAGLYAKARAADNTSTLAPTYPHEAFVDAWLSHWRALLNDEPVVLKPGLMDLLNWANDQGKPCGVATGSGREQLELYFAQADLDRYFQVTVTSDDVVNSKPAPDPYITAASGIGVEPSRCIALEDSNTGCASAVAAGMRVIVVPDLLTPNDTTGKTAEVIVDSLIDAKEHIEHIIEWANK